MKKTVFIFFIGLILVCGHSFAASVDYDKTFGTNIRNQPGYFQNMGHDWERGLKNLVSFPLEIPITIAKYHREDKSAPVFKELAGLVDGIARGATRAASGAWDIAMGFVPGDQDGATVKPETLF